MIKPQRIIADENIPYVEELFASLGEVVRLPGRNIQSEDLLGADILLVRSVTKVNESLLAKSNIKFVGTCTIGTDHLDKQYLDQAGIQYSSAPGCNALGVVQYVLSAMAKLGIFESVEKIGIVGCGNVGGRLYRCLKALGYEIHCYDPFLSCDEIADLGDWEALYDCDLLCVHTPLTFDGQFPTHKMIGAEFFEKLKSGATLLNAGRGEVVDNDALVDYLSENNDLNVVLDVWDGEPNINKALLSKVKFASPHIAGYSFEGKVNGSTMIFEALAKYLKLDQGQIRSVVEKVRRQAFGKPELITKHFDNLRDYILYVYDLSIDDTMLREVAEELPASFDKLRKSYRKRREFSHFVIDVISTNAATANGNSTAKSALSLVLSQHLAAIGFLDKAR